MTVDAIIKDIKAKKYKPIYFLHGEEEYYIDLVSDYIEENILQESEKSFNQTVFYGKETDLATVIMTAKRYPMMAEHQVVIVKEAQNIKFPTKTEKGNDFFSNYIEKPSQSTILVFCYKHSKVDTRLKVFKSIEKHGLLFESKKLYDNQVPDWISNFVIQKGASIKPDATVLLSDFLGNDLLKISNEINKLLIGKPKGFEITLHSIQDNIGISKDYNVFELQSALGRKNIFKANQIIDYFAANKKDNPAVVVLSSLAGYFSKIFVYHCLQDKSKASVASALAINPFFVQDYELAARNYPLDKVIHIISLLRNYDLKIKGVGVNGNTSEGELMRELIWYILH